MGVDARRARHRRLDATACSSCGTRTRSRARRMSPTGPSSPTGARRRRSTAPSSPAGSPRTSRGTSSRPCAAASDCRSCGRRSASFDDEQPVLRLRDVLDLVRAASLEQGREIGVVLEIKHATYFARSRAGTSRPSSRPSCATPAGPRGELPLTIEAFESTVLRRLQGARHPRRRTSICSRPRAGRSTSSRRSARRRRPTGRPRAPAGLDAPRRRRGRDQRRQADDPRARQARPHDRSVAASSPTRTPAACGCSRGHAAPRTRSSSGSSAAAAARRHSATRRRSGR